MLTPIIETDRILLRPIGGSGTAEVFCGWTGDPEVAVHMRWNVHQSAGETKEWLSEEEAGAAKDSRRV